jgi:hypothetical protein
MKTSSLGRAATGLDEGGDGISNDTADNAGATTLPPGSHVEQQVVAAVVEEASV